MKLQNHILYKKQGKWPPLLVSILFLVIQSSYSQIGSLALEHLTNKFEELSEKQVSDVVYLQTSKGIYETQEDVWFKGYVLDAKHFIPSTKSKVLFVQLIEDATNQQVWEEKYEIENGFVDGHIYLQDSLKAGNYTLAAYSSHSYFKKQKAFYALRKVKVLKSIQEKTILKTVKDTTLHFSLFPEGGHLVAGIQSRMAFKAVNVKGFPIETSGALYENDMVIVKFKSSHAGMGSFLFTPDHTKKYQVKLSAPKTTKTYNIPNIELRGKTLELLRITKDEAFFKIAQSANNSKETVYIRVQIRGEVQSIARAILETERILKIPLKDFPQGIAEVTLFNQELQPVAERLLYVHQDQDLHIKTVLDKSVYKTKEKVTLKLQATNNANKPVIAHLGLSVYDKLYTNEQDTKTIQSHYYLSTQLKGNLYNPSYYFNKKNKDRKAALNNLLLTQGWRAYQWAEANLKQLGETKRLLVKDNIAAELYTNSKNQKNIQQLDRTMVLVFGSDTLQKKVFIQPNKHKFSIMPSALKIGEGGYVYAKPLLPRNSRIHVRLQDHYSFHNINHNKKTRLLAYPLPNQNKTMEREPIQLFIIPNKVTRLDEVVIKGKKKKRVFRDKYMGRLDSLAKLLQTQDFVCHDNSHREGSGAPYKKYLTKYRTAGVLNCPYHPTSFGLTRPIAGETYTVIYDKNYKRLNAYSDESDAADFGSAKYFFKTPTLTESELLRKFNLATIKGYYGKKKFYSPVYDKIEQIGNFPDYRNTLFWKPDIITNEKGEAVIDFFCSDINSLFLGEIEGVSGTGLLGSDKFEFTVVKRDD